MGHFKFLQGNEACVEGAIAVGALFFGGYPITPSSEVAQAASIKLPPLGGYYIQMEDEIASIAAIIGASLSGMKAFTATSGPGFSLMQEHLGMAIMGEVPCVIVNVSRNGPSTGMATKPAQGDVMQTRWGTHGDHSIIVLTPATVQECFDLTVRAFNLSEKYRTPVIVMTDKTLGQMREKLEIKSAGEIEIINRKKPTCPPSEYKPYQAGADGIPPLASYGDEHLLRINSSTHGENGLIDASPQNAIILNQRLRDKIENNAADICSIKTYRTDDAETIIIAFGTSARAARRAVTLSRAEGKKTGLIQLLTLWPLPVEKIKATLSSSCRNLIVPEMNMGQLVLEIERIIKNKKIYQVNKWSGEDILPREILDCIEEANI